MSVSLAWALPMIPAVMGIAGLLVSFFASRESQQRWARETAAGLGIVATAIAWLASVLLLTGGTVVTTSAVLANFGDIAVTASLRVDAAAAAVAVAVSTVALLVQVYSVAYLRGDDRYPPYAAQISLFTAAMLLVVTADDLVLLLIGWEIMGACSYLLIGHYRTLPEAPAAAVKAFLVTRVGDIGFLLGVLWLGLHAGTFHIGTVLSGVGNLDSGILLAAGLLILIGAIGKSAQFPLHTWLPDAMAGPTPISALIHAATMVAAGAYVLVRLLPIYTAPATTIIAAIAAVTMLLAAFAALATDDLKRVLAWSTVSQVAFMFGGVAIGAPDAALFHLLSHAAFKALLFLCAGAVIHMVAGNSMAAMGGLREGAPVTFWTMTAGFAALAGIPPLSGFWSKESILGAAWAADSAAGALVWWAGVVTVALTAAYCTRAWLRTFLGAPRSPSHPHDPEPLMRWPLLVLTVPTIGLGVLAIAGPLTDLPGFHLGPTLVVTVVALAAAAGTYLLWRRDPAADPVRQLGRWQPILADGLHLDRVQDALVVRPLRALAAVTRRGDERLVDGAVEATGAGTVRFARGLAALHRAGVPRHLLAVLGGALLIGAISVAAYWGVLS